MEKKRFSFIDVLRILACFLVIVNHTNSTIFLECAPSVTWFTSVTYFFVSKVAVPIFIMISGYTMLDRQDDYPKIFKKVLRMLIILVLASLLYYLDAGYMGLRSTLNIKDFFISVLNGPLTNALWYMYLYIALLIMLPFLQKFVRALSKKDLEIFFIISGIVFGVWPILVHIKPSLQYSECVTLPLFDSYLCMLMLGYYIKKYVNHTHKKLIGASILFFAALTFNVVMTYVEYVNNDGVNYLFYDNRTFLPILVESICLFYIISRVSLGERAMKGLKLVGGCTFGIYIISDFVIEKMEFVFDSLCMRGVHPMFAVFVYEIVVFCIGLIITCVLKWVMSVGKSVIFVNTGRK